MGGLNPLLLRGSAQIETHGWQMIFLTCPIRKKRGNHVSMECHSVVIPEALYRDILWRRVQIEGRGFPARAHAVAHLSMLVTGTESRVPNRRKGLGLRAYGVW
jgi:hypothetical protein